MKSFTTSLMTFLVIAFFVTIILLMVQAEQGAGGVVAAP